MRIDTIKEIKNDIIENTCRNIKDELEIVIITYNRDKLLKFTLERLLIEYSPVKQCQITVLDNCSDDETKKICEIFCKQYGNIRHKINRKNIGGNANVCRAYEIASKPYIWCLADDDEFDWTNWYEIENAIYQGYDAIFTTLTNLSRHQGIGAVLMECTFVPGCIYKTDKITSDVIQGMYDNIHTFLPHLSIAINIISENGSFYIPTYPIVRQQFKYEYIPEIAKKNNKRGINKSLSVNAKYMFWEVGFIEQVANFSETVQSKIYTSLSILYGCKSNYIRHLIKYYLDSDCSSNNLFDIYRYLKNEYKDEFLKTMFEYFEMEKFDKVPLSKDEWNMLFIDSVAKKKSSRLRSKIKALFRNWLLRLLEITNKI